MRAENSVVIKFSSCPHAENSIDISSSSCPHAENSIDISSPSCPHVENSIDISSPSCPHAENSEISGELRKRRTRELPASEGGGGGGGRTCRVIHLKNTFGYYAACCSQYINLFIMITPLIYYHEKISKEFLACKTHDNKQKTLILFLKCSLFRLSTNCMSCN